MISFYLKRTFTEYKASLSTGLDRIWQTVHNDVSLIVHLNAGYFREQFSVPFYFLFTFAIFQTA